MNLGVLVPPVLTVSTVCCIIQIKKSSLSPFHPVILHTTNLKPFLQYLLELRNMLRV